MRTQDFTPIPLYSTVKINVGAMWEGVLIYKYMPEKTTEWQGLVFVEKNGNDYMYASIWVNIANLSFIKELTPIHGTIVTPFSTQEVIKDFETIASICKKHI